VYTPPREDVLFGDIFEAPYFFDVHLRANAARLAFGEFPKKAPLSGHFYIEPNERVPLGDSALVRAYGRSGREREGREHRHTFLLPGRAVLLSDDCHIPTAYGDRPDRSEARGRLMFAPIVDVDKDELAKVAEGSTFGRFALPANTPLPGGGVAELRRTFLVVAEAVDPKQRLAALDEQGRTELEKRWNAFACRRGPLSARENAAKLLRLLVGDEAFAEHDDVAVAVWQTLDLAWEFEGKTMRAASDALESGGESRPILQQVIDDLKGLELLAREARGRLEQLPR
jgi:hypothetical protein